MKACNGSDVGIFFGDAHAKFGIPKLCSSLENILYTEALPSKTCHLDVATIA